MKATGIVKKIDGLGRVVIPKEFRKSMKINEGDELEIFIQEGMVCFKKYVDDNLQETLENILTASKAVCRRTEGIEYDGTLIGSNSEMMVGFQDSYGNTLDFWFSAPPSLTEMELIKKIIYAFTD